uniref:Uncharacterized protein n=1 Tax=Tanacetum cinerariifolium TaxID=118510 RepID=A0A6L2K3H6_TANCI|nr:hypothetical protein [Tanacetum cinerariifolium]
MMATTGPRQVRFIATCSYSTNISKATTKAQVHVSKDFRFSDSAEQGGSTPKIPNLQQFNIFGEGQMTIEDAKAQMEEIKRRAALQLKKDKTKKRLKKAMTPDEIKAQAVKMAGYEAKRAKIPEEYNQCINLKGLWGTRGLLIRELKSRIFFYIKNFDLVFQREEEFHLATTAQLIRTQIAVKRDTPNGKELFNTMEFAIKARSDVT